MWRSLESGKSCSQNAATGWIESEQVKSWSTPGATTRLKFVSSPFALNPVLKYIQKLYLQRKNGISLKALCRKDKLSGQDLLKLLNLSESIGCSEGSCYTSVDLWEFTSKLLPVGVGEASASCSECLFKISWWSRCFPSMFCAILSSHGCPTLPLHSIAVIHERPVSHCVWFESLAQCLRQGAHLSNVEGNFLPSHDPLVLLIQAQRVDARGPLTANVETIWVMPWLPTIAHKFIFILYGLIRTKSLHYTTAAARGWQCRDWFDVTMILAWSYQQTLGNDLSWLIYFSKGCCSWVLLSGAAKTHHGSFPQVSQRSCHIQRIPDHQNSTET